MDYIAAATAADPANAAAYAMFGDLFEHKLWHELTMAMDEWVRTEAAQARPLLPLLDSFVVKFEQRMNQLRYAQLLGAVVAASVDVSKALTADEGIARLNAVLTEKRVRLGVEASLFLEMEACLLALKAGLPLQPVKEKLDATKPLVDALTGATDTAVFQKYHFAEAEYYRRVGPPEAFYHAALALLAYAPADAMTLPERRALATDMALAALAGDGVYNFGEVLATPILQALEGTPDAWLGSVLAIFARGDIDAFNVLLHDHAAAFDAQPALVARADFVKEKIALLALMNLIFETPSQNRTLAFADVAQRVRLQLDQVEWLIMRAMALNLVRGTLDQVEQCFDVT